MVSLSNHSEIARILRPFDKLTAQDERVPWIPGLGALDLDIVLCTSPGMTTF
jgi:hypothetical protein